MTTMVMSNQTTAGSRHSLEELVDRVMDALLGQTCREAQSVARSVHDARRLRRSGDTGGALAVLGGVDIGSSSDGEVRWAYSEWLGLARRRYAGSGALLYSQGTGRGAVLRPAADGMLEVAAAIGMRWRPGRIVSRRSVRGLRALDGGGR